MIGKFHGILFGTLRRQLIVGVAVVHAVMMALFIVDLTRRQQAMILDRQTEHAVALAHTLATSAAGWLAADDISGLQELAEAQRRYPDLAYAMLLNDRGEVLAHTDESRIGQYVLDLPGEVRETVLSKNAGMVDVMVPAMLAERHVGWARAGIGQRQAGRKLTKITRDGAIYAICAILIGSLLALLMGKRITRRLHEIQSVMEEVRSGNHEARSGLTGTDEAAAMANHFNTMLDMLRQREKAVMQSENKFRSLIQNIQAAVIVHGPDTGVVASNSFAQKMLDLTEDQMLGKEGSDPAWNFLREDGSVMPVGEYPINQVVVAGHPLRDYVVGIKRPSPGEVVWALVNADPVFGDDGKLSQVLVSFVDITGLRRAEENLRESEKKYRTLYEESFDGLFISSPDGRIIDLNRTCVSMFGYGSKKEMLGLDLARDVYDNPADRTNVLEMVNARGVAEYEVAAKKKNGEKMTAFCSLTAVRDEKGAVACCRGIIRDITKERNLEAQFLQAQKMEAVGRLAGGVAHDFNNLLTVILGYCDLALTRIGVQEPIRCDLEEIRKASDRCATLTRQLLAFSRKQILVPKVVNLGDVVADMDKMLRRLIGEDIDLVSVRGKDLWNVKADPGQIEQVILNLAVNSRDAMPRGGKLTIETGNVVLDETYVLGHKYVSPGCYVMLAVSDTGCGMDEGTLARIFDPFFTTKERGTGLGLSTVYGIVKQSGGYIHVYSEPGIGTTFKMYFPHVEESAERVSRAGALPLEELQGSETILLVEDEDPVRQMVREILVRYGYAVLEARNGDEALEYCSNHRETIHLMLSDVVMPGMSGVELSKRLAGIQPGMKVLFMSGYTAEAIVHQGILDSGIAFIHKPFAMDELMHKVREVLGSGAEKS